MIVQRTILSLLFLCGTLPALSQRWAPAQIPAPYDAGYYLDIFFLPSNQNYGWACDRYHGYVIRTTNGGRTWQGAQTDSACHLEYIQFLSTSVGFCSGPCGAFKSTDGGATWSRLTLDTVPTNIWGGWFRSETDGWLTGGGCGVNNFYRTVDGGSTWTRYQDTSVKRSNLADPLWQPDLPASTVFAAGNGTLWKSQDSGATWSVEAYTGANSPWHEEISRSGNSFMVSCATSNCASGGYSGGGMRVSHDDGATWSHVETGNDMFGVFMITNQKAWAVGTNANVWYTETGGALASEWSLKNCGLNGRHMDDVFFLNDSTGWVVGEGVYYLAKPLRELSDSVLLFLGACPDSNLYDTVYVNNVNFSSSPWSIELVGEHAWMYRVVNVIPDPLPACSRTRVIVEYRALAAGRRQASMVIRIREPDTTLAVLLEGERRTFNAKPTDTLVQFNHRAGSPINRVLEWTAAAPPLESIVDIQRDSGSTQLSLAAEYPTIINAGPPVAQSFIGGTLADTGWVQARFRVTLAPCQRDTHITIRAYGLSPIIRSDTTASASIGCEMSDTLRIPLANTGNMDLTVYSMNVLGLSPESFQITGLRNAGSQPPWRVLPGESDTILIVVTPSSSDVSGVLQINHDDATTARGSVQPWNVNLRATSNSVLSSVSPLAIDLGEVCEGEVVDTSFTISNQGPSLFRYTTTENSARINNLQSGTRVVLRGENRSNRFTWTATGTGVVSDTILVRITPCDTAVAVIVTAKIRSLSLELSPNPLIDSVSVGQSLVRQVTIRNGGMETVVIGSIAPLKMDAEFSVNFAPPVTLPSGRTIDVTVSWTPSSVRTYSTDLLVTLSGPCAATASAQILLRALSNEFQVKTPELHFDAGCDSAVRIDSVEIHANSTDASFHTPVISPVPSAFTVVRPTTAFSLPQGTSEWVVVAYDPRVERQAQAILQLESSGTRSVVDIPLTGSAAYAAWTASPQSLEYLDVRACDPPVVQTITITNKDTSEVTIGFDASALPPWITVSGLPITLAGLGSVAVNVTCDPSRVPIGTSAAVMTLVDETCGNRITIRLSAQRIDGGLILEPDPVDAGSVVVGRSTQVAARIINPTEEARTILDLQLASAAGWLLLDNVIGVQVPPADTIAVLLQFEPTLVGPSTTTLSLVEAGRCTTSTDIGVRGVGLPYVPPP